MHDFLSFNHQIATASQTFLPAVSSATFYGRGIFTTLAIYNSTPFQWAKHWRRLTANADTINLDLSEFAEETVKNSLAALIDRNNLKNARARLTFFDESASGIWQTENQGSTSLLMTSADFRSVPDGLRLTVSPYRVNSKSPLVNVKSCNYLENLLVLEEARKRGFDETLRLNENNKIVSAAIANVFWTRNGDIFTPPLETGALDGTTRDFVLKSFAVAEKTASLEELTAADEIFLVSAGIGIAAVESFEDTRLSSAEVYRAVRKIFDRSAKENT